ncbi:oligosaccharide flippase family protein [Candidatus Marinimicrobia bacterium]|nr:oligosaccharide flippase family protein [Candidatus Neomarinimicrobiota bacterium]
MKNSLIFNTILKNTIRFSILRVAIVFIKILLNKTIAVYLGVGGLGLYGIFQTILNLIQSVFSLGISKALVREIPAVNDKSNIITKEAVISSAVIIICILSILSMLFTLIFSESISIYFFGDDKYSFYIKLISIGIFFTILSEGQLAILNGLRKLNYLLKANLYGVFLGCFLGIISIITFGEIALVLTLITVPASIFFISIYFLKNSINYRINLNIFSLIKSSKNTIITGISLVYISFWIYLTDYILKFYILQNSDLEMVGLFQAGCTIIVSYFGIISSSMATDYFPRISTNHKNNTVLNDYLNKQAVVGLVIMGPLLILITLISDFAITLLFNNSFIESKFYIQNASFGVLLIAVSNPLTMILIAKQERKTYVLIVTICRIIGIAISLFSFSKFGLHGLGASYIFFTLPELILSQMYLKRKYNIYANSVSLKILLCYFILLLITVISLNYFNSNHFTINFFIFIISVVLSYLVGKHIMKINFKEIINLKNNE